MWLKVHFLHQPPRVAWLCLPFSSTWLQAAPLNPSTLNIVHGKVIGCLQLQIQVWTIWTITVLLSWIFKTGLCCYLKPEASDGAEVPCLWKWAPTMMATQKGSVCYLSECKVVSEFCLSRVAWGFSGSLNQKKAKATFSQPRQKTVTQTTSLDQNCLMTCMAFFFTDI